MEYDTYGSGGTEVFAMLLAFTGIFMVVGLVSYIINSLATMLMLKKAGHPRAWGAWVPFYNQYLILTFGGQKPLWFWVYLASTFVVAIPLIGSVASSIGYIFFLIAYVYAIIFINKSFGRDDSLVLWTLFGFFLFPIWALVLGLSDNEYYRANSPLFLNKEGYPPEAW